MVEEAPASVDAEHRRIGGIPLRAFAPNAITLLALCSGLTGVRFAIDGDWAAAITMIIVAGVLDGMDGRIARLLRAQSKFGAELDSLSDVIAFGVAPAMILFFWSLDEAPKFGRSEEHTSELQSLMRTSYAVFCLKKKTRIYRTYHTITQL